MRDAFSSDFYIATATVIPVLYLALAVQGSALDAMLTWLYGVTVRKGERFTWFRAVTKGRAMRVVGISTRVFASIMVLALALSLIGSFIGEVIAILVLYRSQSSSWQALYVLISVISLVAMIALVTFGRLAATFFRVLSIAVRDRRDQRRAMEIALETGEQPLNLADFRSQFVSMGTRERAEKFAEELIPMLPPQAQRRRGSPTDDEIWKALDEAFPP